MDWERLLKFRCTGCGNCCRGTMVMATDTDVRRIVAGTGQPPAAFVRFVGDDEIILAKRSPWWVQMNACRVVMALRWKRGSCVFLDAQQRCSIYEHRPLACREYPFNVTLSDSGAVDDLSLSRIVKCEHACDGKQTRRSLRAMSLWNDRESDAYTDKVFAWNRNHNGCRRTQAEFLRYLDLLPAIQPETRNASP